MEKIALFPGTFDPITLGHIDIAKRALNIFDKVIIGIGTNIAKVPMYSVEQRIDWLNEIFKDEKRIVPSVYEGLTVKFCQELNAKYIVRGIRFVSDFEYEKMIADMNRSLDAEIETVFLTCLPIYNSVASTMVRDVIKNNGDASMFLPDVVRKTIYNK
ncbi:pantetheine-phosphate adenylyltransferase [Rhizosphaericola mali]|uniref:Phosphopantetheine adenylyltransferase n=1 Tax=Rhizosphaericola mali TaxID=2545455 RepID=A0A5P2GC83_9BACT|nr:pantetheine-phosphate adenylyltransferase [Rhizosphaericola mali]QES90823.1 pantetheine-phosphate adenylyltransferase [Rhizosphaericola mali]